MSSESANLETSDGKQSKMDWSRLFSAAVTLMALGVPVLYLIGLAFDQGYQSVFRVPEVARSAGFYETLTLGFISIQYSLGFLNEWMKANWQWMAGYALLVGLVSAAALWWSPDWLRHPKNKVRAWLRSHTNAAKALVSASLALITFGLPYLVVVVVWVLLSLPLLSHRVGTAVAHRNIARQAPTCDAAEADQSRYQQCVIAKKGTQVVRGYLIAATEKYFVIALDGGTRAFPTDGWEFESTYIAKR